jgi:hypothetical protein
MTDAAPPGAATALAKAAFGDDPGRWPLPAARTPHELWLRAVVAGGQGRYGSAFADLAEMRRVASASPLASLGQSTRGSFLRQLGWHIRARSCDGRAWALAVPDVAGPAAPVPDVAGWEAGADALIGLAADALGVRRFAASQRSLERARQLLDDGGPPARLPVRLEWVTAELAMATGDGAAAVGHARRAVELAGPLGSARHVVKSEVILAAALGSAGELRRCRAVADAALETTDRLGLTPLRWALACLLAAVGSERHSPIAVLGIRDVAADTVRMRGGAWSDR